MIISCQCLNVTVSAKGSEVQAVGLPQLDLSVLELADPFFKENVGTVEILHISKLQGGLVQVRNIGNWIIYQCLNCSINTHAIHRERGAAHVLISGAMLTNPDEIAALKTSEKYSAVFRMVVNHSDGNRLAPQVLAKITVGQLDAPVQSAMSAIQQQLGEAIQVEVARVEEEVRAYSEQKYAALEEFREKAHKDHRALSQLLIELKDNLSSAPKTTFIDGANAQSRTVALDGQNIPPPIISSAANQFPIKISAKMKSSPVPTFGNVISETQRQIGGEPLIPSNKIMKTNSSIPVGNDGGAIRADKTDRKVKTRLFNQSLNDTKKDGSLDAEGLFDLEGMDETPAEVFHSEGESDTDDSGSHDEGIHIPRSRSAQFAMAKSLPMNVPAFLSASVHSGARDYDERHPQETMDIAASIKALARSVHGESNVFGELPRPRFSTQI